MSLSSGCASFDIGCTALCCRLQDNRKFHIMFGGGGHRDDNYSLTNNLFLEAVSKTKWKFCVMLQLQILLSLYWTKNLWIRMGEKRPYFHMSLFIVGEQPCRSCRSALGSGLHQLSAVQQQTWPELCHPLSHYKLSVFIDLWRRCALAWPAASFSVLNCDLWS